jgi:Domain of unknown function (DUF4873)
VIEEPEGYTGEVTLAVGTEVRTAEAVLAARFDPLAGSVVWSGRVATELPLRTRVVISTAHGEGTAETIERDAWGNTRMAGIGRSPFPVELLDGVVEA